VTEYGSKARFAHRRDGGVGRRVEAAARQAAVVTCTSPEEVVNLGRVWPTYLAQGAAIAIITQGAEQGHRVRRGKLARVDACSLAGRALRVARSASASVLEQAEPARSSRVWGGDVSSQVIKLSRSATRGCRDGAFYPGVPTSIAGNGS